MLDLQTARYRCQGLLGWTAERFWDATWEDIMFALAGYDERRQDDLIGYAHLAAWLLTQMPGQIWFKKKPRKYTPEDFMRTRQPKPVAEMSREERANKYHEVMAKMQRQKFAPQRKMTPEEFMSIARTS